MLGLDMNVSAFGKKGEKPVDFQYKIGCLRLILLHFLHILHILICLTLRASIMMLVLDYKHLLLRRLEFLLKPSLLSLEYPVKALHVFRPSLVPEDVTPWSLESCCCCMSLISLDLDVLRSLRRSLRVLFWLQ